MKTLFLLLLVSSSAFASQTAKRISCKLDGTFDHIIAIEVQANEGTDILTTAVKVKYETAQTQVLSQLIHGSMADKSILLNQNKQAIGTTNLSLDKNASGKYDLVKSFSCDWIHNEEYCHSSIGSDEFQEIERVKNLDCQISL